MVKKKIIVTGGMGYIGSHTVVELISAGFDTVIVDNLSNSDISILDGIEKIIGRSVAFEQIDLTDLEATNSVFTQHNDAIGVIHFAALKSVGDSVINPLKYYQNNLVSLFNVINGMRDNQINHLIFSSSCTVYGQPEHLPVTEDSPLLPSASPYGTTKQMSEKIIEDIASQSEEFTAITLRYFNPIGAHHSALIGELPRGVPNNLLPYITQTAIGKMPVLKVFGDDYSTNDGTAIRDYIHVVDLAKAHITSLERLINKQNKAPFEIFNLGTGTGYSVLEIISSFEKATGLKINYQIVERRAGDVERIYADTHLANTELKWKAELGIDEMTSSAWAWEKARAK